MTDTPDFESMASEIVENRKKITEYEATIADRDARISELMETQSKKDAEIVRLQKLIVDNLGTDKPAKEQVPIRKSFEERYIDMIKSNTKE